MNLDMELIADRAEYAKQEVLTGDLGDILS